MKKDNYRIRHIILRIYHIIKFQLYNYIFLSFFDEKFKIGFKCCIFYILREVCVGFETRWEFYMILLNSKGGQSNFLLY